MKGPATTTPVPFFHMSASYSIAPGATRVDLMEDSRAMMDSALAILQAVPDAIAEQTTYSATMVWGAVYLLRQSLAAIEAAQGLKGGTA